MKLIVGLGNPGPQYETTRHNAGFLAADRLIENWKATGPNKKNQAEIYQAELNGEKVLIIKPQTFMNRSGRSVGPIFSFFKCKPEDLIVLHDDIDLPPLSLRIKTGGGSGGHNGIKSIDQSVGNDNIGYHRIRIGVGRPAGGGADTVDHVLDQFDDQELRDLDQILDKVVQAVEKIIAGDVAGAMNNFNRRQE